MPFVRAHGLLSVVSAILVTFAASTPTPMRAQEAGQEGTQRVGVVLLPRGSASSDMTDSLTELLIAAVAARGATQIVGKEEFQAALGRDDAGTLACIESDACLGRMGRELGVSQLIAGTLRLDPATDAHPERFRFELYRLDVESGTARGHVAREVDAGFSALLSALTASVDELYVERVEPGAVVLSTSPPEVSLTIDDTAVASSEDGSYRRDFLVPGPHQLVARASGHEPLAREFTIEAGTTLMLSLELAPRIERLEVSALTIALGGVGVVALGVGIGIGQLSQSSPTESLNMRGSDAFYAARETEALVANVLFAVGGAFVIGALVSLAVDLTSSSEASLERALARASRGEIVWW